jgi:hypothetical protein
MLKRVIRGIPDNDLAGDARKTVHHHGPLEIDRGPSVRPEGDDIKEQDVIGTFDPESAHFLRGNVGRVTIENLERADNKKRERLIVFSAQPMERLVCRGENIPLGLLEAEQAGRKMDYSFASQSERLRWFDFDCIHLAGL